MTISSIFSKWQRSIVKGLFILILAVGCSQPSPKAQLEAVVKSSTNCIAPCWNGLIPGKSNKRDFLMLVDEIDQERFANLRRTELWYKNSIGYQWNDRTYLFVGAIGIERDQLVYLSFRRLDKLTIETIFEVLGYPDFYTAEVSVGESYLLELNLLYEKQGVITHIIVTPFKQPVSMFSQPTCQIKVEMDMPIQEIYLVETDSATEMLETVYPFISSNSPQPWINGDLIPVTDCQ